MFKKWIVPVCVLEILFLFILQHIYGNVLSINEFVAGIILIILFNLFLTERLNERYKKIIFIVQLIFLVFVPNYSIFSSPHYTYASAIEQITQNIQKPYVIDENRQVVFIRNKKDELIKGYHIRVTKDKVTVLYAFDPWTGKYYVK